MTKVFIGMPTYNGSRHMAQAIESILNQTFTDFTLYISDDASTDSTGSIAQSYALKDSRVVYYRQPQNLGMFGNFKFVLDKADAVYFMWMAHDDIREVKYLETCVVRLDADPNLGLATTTVALIDTFGRTQAVEKEIEDLSGTPSIIQIAKYLFIAEGLGKANIMYGLWRTEAAQVTWDAYPQRKVWAQDYHVALALVARYGVYVDPNPLFKKRLGGASSPELEMEEKLPVRVLSFKERNNTFPFKRFKHYLKGHLEALRGTPYQWLAVLVLLLRLPRSFLVYAKERNYRKFFRQLFTWPPLKKS